jgi:hypothetical protein
MVLSIPVCAVYKIHSVFCVTVMSSNMSIYNFQHVAKIIMERVMPTYMKWETFIDNRIHFIYSF